MVRDLSLTRGRYRCAGGVTPRPRWSRRVSGVEFRAENTAVIGGPPMGTMHPDFTGDVALVTGAAGGMGRAIALAFATAGATVVAADVDVAGGEETASDWCEPQAGRPTSSSPTSPTDAVEALVAHRRRPVRQRRLCGERGRHRERDVAVARVRARVVRADAGGERPGRVPVHEVRDRGDAHQRANVRADAGRSSTSPRRTRSGRSRTSRRTRRRSTRSSDSAGARRSTMRAGAFAST